VLDCEGYRGGRDHELAELAVSIAEKVRKTRQAVEMDPLNSYERRIIHLTLADEPGVSSHSEGDGFLKRIIVSPV
jgi:spoIIIJ-associated protein